MSLTSTIRSYLRVMRSQDKAVKTLDSEGGHLNYLAAEVIRFTHSIEKGLSLERPRPGFGHDRQKLLTTYISQLEASQDPYHAEVIKMGFGALNSYVTWHEEINYTDDVIEQIKAFLTEHCHGKNYDDYGGVITLQRSDLNFDVGQIEQFFQSRHSIRDYDDTDIDDARLLKALELAQCSPSACNRQAVRVYVLSAEASKEYAKELEGIGGFADSANRIILITAKLSSYRKDEIDQYIVSASMYAAYLTLTLHLYHMGACLAQRPVIWDKKWASMQEQFNIPEDEQLICLLTVGNLKDETTVPRSHRLSSDITFKFLN